MIRLFWVFLLLGATAQAEILTLEGLPIQMEWGDVNGDKQPDLVALMLVSQTEGSVETWFVDGKLQGVYEDHTQREKYLATWVKKGDSWEEQDRMNLGMATILGFHLKDSNMMLWGNEGLTPHHWSESGWQASQTLPTPGLLASEGVHMSEFPFLQSGPSGDVWVVPDLNGIHLIPLNQPDAGFFRAYPESAFLDNGVYSNKQQITLAMPKTLDLDGDGVGELVFQGRKHLTAWSLTENGPSYNASLSGRLADLNGDGLVDLVKEYESEIEKRKDLPKVETLLKIYYADGPLNFPEKPDKSQSVAGLLVDTEDSTIAMPYPYLDLNNDGRMDIAGMAFKLSLFQIAKVVTTQRITIKFLLNLSYQKEDGAFEKLANGPFEMSWKVNLRRLRMPAFAQMAADFDGDGWLDILMEKKNKLEITPVTRSGFQPTLKWKRKLPSSLRDPDQVYGRDLNGDGKADFVVLKIKGGQTLLGVLEQDR